MRGLPDSPRQHGGHGDYTEKTTNVLLFSVAVVRALRASVVNIPTQPAHAHTRAPIVVRLRPDPGSRCERPSGAAARSAPGLRPARQPALRDHLRLDHGADADAQGGHELRRGRAGAGAALVP